MRRKRFIILKLTCYIVKDLIRCIIQSKPAANIFSVNCVGFLGFWKDNCYICGIIKSYICLAYANTILCQLQVAEQNHIGEAGGKCNLICKGARFWEKSRESTAGYNERLITCRQANIPNMERSKTYVETFSFF